PLETYFQFSVKLDGATEVVLARNGIEPNDGEFGNPHDARTILAKQIGRPCDCVGGSYKVSPFSAQLISYVDCGMKTAYNLIDTSESLVSSCAVSNLKKVSLELGGKSPLIIFSDCELTRQSDGTTGKASTPTSLTEQEHQMNNVDKLTFQLQQIKNERDELRVMLANHINKDLNNRQNFELEMLNMEHKKVTLDAEILPEDISEVFNQCKKLTEENVSYSQLLSECTQLKEKVSILREENQKLWGQQISLQESCEELKQICGEAQEKIYDLQDKEKQGGLLEYPPNNQTCETETEKIGGETGIPAKAERDLVTKQKVFVGKLQHYFAVSQLRYGVILL
ncbi:hypothetical protein STEG23_005563, partial [Scotinomys teguina]